jgi:hypothetical protein
VSGEQIDCTCIVLLLQAYAGQCARDARCPMHGRQLVMAVERSNAHMVTAWERLRQNMTEVARERDRLQLKLSRVRAMLAGLSQQAKVGRVRRLDDLPEVDAMLAIIDEVER